MLRPAGIICVLMLVILSENHLNAQNIIQHQPPTLIERSEAELLEFRIIGISDNQISEALLFTKPSTSGSFSQREVRVINGLIQTPIEITNSSITDIEYYLRIRLTDGSEFAYPDIGAGEAPISVNVVEPDGDEVYEVAEFIDYTILSPTLGNALSDEDLLIAVALFYDDEDTEGGEFRLIMNGEDVTSQSEISPYVLKYKPGSSLSDGNQQVQVRFVKEETTYEVANWNFRVLTGEPVAFGTFEQPARRSPSGNLELGARNQEISGARNDALTGRIRVSGKEGNLEYSLSGYMTSQDDNRLQPQNRYSADIRYGRWLEFQAGDVYPYVSDMTISGRRVRGIHSKIRTPGESMELQFLWGQMNRRIPNLYDTVLADDTEFGTNYFLTLEDGGRGVFKQDVIGTRLAFGRENSFRIAFHGMRIQDDTTSINIINNYQQLLQHDAGLNSGLSQADRQFLIENPDELQVAGSNPRPRGNFVAGSDLSFALDNQRVRFKTEAGISLLNQDISDGFLTQERADELGIDLDADIENLFDRISWLIIINENMSTLPFRFSENGNGDLELEPFFPTAVLASDSRVNLNYFGNQLDVRYRWIGPDYQSLANSTIRRDVRGITLTDRFRLLQNRIYVTLGFEDLNDNVLGEKQATTNSRTYSGSLSWFPVNRILPRVNFSSRFRVRDNGIERFNPSVTSEFANVAVRNFQMEDGEVVSAPAPRLRETLALSSSVTQNFNLFDLNHQAIVSFGITQTEDKKFGFGDSKSRNFSTRLLTRLDNINLPVRARIGFNVNSSESVGGLSTVTIRGFDLGAESILLNGNLMLNTDLAFTRNRFESTPLTTTDNSAGEAIYTPAGEEDRTVRETTAFIIRTTAQYNIHLNHAIAATANITNLRVTLGDTGSVPSDQVLQLRYIFNF